MQLFDTLMADVQFRLATLTATNVIDILLVAVIFYGLVHFVRQTKAAVLIRGVLLLIVLLLGINFILPLPTLDRVLWGCAIALLIATPVTLQPELRRALEQVGRSRWLHLGQPSQPERLAHPLARALRQMAAERVGALIVLQGQESLAEYIETGVPIDGQVSEELLRTIFYDKAPLHDGAIVISEGRVVAAGCVLPLTDRQLGDSGRRMGTRHRAAVGISEQSDGLALVVSEETGRIAYALGGQLYRNQDEMTVTNAIIAFYQRPSAGQARRPSLPMARRLNIYATSALTALPLAVLAWAVVIGQINPLREVTIANVQLRATELPPGTRLVTGPPSTISVTVRTTQADLESLGPDSFSASLDLAKAGVGLQRMPILVNASVANVQLQQSVPAVIDVELVAINQRSVPVEVVIIDQDAMPVVFERVGTPTISVLTATISGPAPLVSVVTKVMAELSVAQATTTMRKELTLKAFNAANEVVNGVEITPGVIQATQSIRRRLDVRESAVHTVVNGVPPDGYWLSSLSVSPAVITLQGEPDVLRTLDNFIRTLSVDIGSIYGNGEILVPLDLPDGLRAFDANGLPVHNVTVFVGMSARQGDALLSRPLEIQNADGKQVELAVDMVEILINGPLPIIREIEANPELVRAIIDVRELPLNRAITVAPTVILPELIDYQLINATIVVTVTP